MYRAAAAFLTLLLILLSASSCSLITVHDPSAPDETEGTSAASAAPDTDAPAETSGGTAAETTAAPSRAASRRAVEDTDTRAMAEDYLAALSDWDFGGIAVSLTAVDASVFAPDDAEGVVNPARLERNRMAADKYNTILLTGDAPIGDITENLRTSILADDYYTDLVAVPLESVGLLQQRGWLMSVLTLPFTDYTAPYFNAAAMEQLTAGYGVWAAVGDFNVNAGELPCVYFNRTMAESLGLDPYALAYGGEWDWEDFRTMAKKASAAGYGGHGSSYEETEYRRAAFRSGGVNTVFCERGSVPVLTDGGKNGDLVKTLRRLFGSDDTYGKKGAQSAFLAGDLLFYTDGVYFASWIADLPFDWGVLPLPSFTGFTTPLPLSSQVLCVPANSTNSEYTGLLLQALNAASYRWIDDLLLDDLMRYTVRDSDTLNMLDVVMGRRGGRISLAFEDAFGSALPELAAATSGAMKRSLDNNFSYSSCIESARADAEKALARAFVMIGGEEEEE